MIPFEVLDSLGDIHMMCENWKHFLRSIPHDVYVQLTAFFLLLQIT